MAETDQTTVSELLDDLARAHVRIRLADDGRLQVTAPKGALTQELRERLARGKPELVAQLSGLTGNRSDDTALPTVVPDPRSRYEPFPPSDLQASFLIGSREGFEYYVRPHQYFEYALEELVPDRLEQALNDELHYQRDNLVVVRDDMRLQLVRDPARTPLRTYDLRHLSPAKAKESVDRVRAEIVRTEPVHNDWPWVDMRLSLLPDGSCRLHYNNNNLFVDAPAIMRFVDSVLRRYREPDWSPPELEISYRDCVLTLAELEASPLGEKSRTYWTDRIADWPQAPAVPLAPGADPRRRSRLTRREMLFPPQVWEALQEKAAARNLTTTNVLSAIQAEVLSCWSGSRHFLINNMITHRLPLHPQMADVMGNFASLYPLEADWRPDEPFEERARRLQAQVMTDVEHVHWSGVKVLQALNQARHTPGRAVCPFAIGSALFVGSRDRPVESLLETPQTLLDCEFWDLTDGRLWVVWDVIEDMFPDGLMDAMEAGYRSVVGQLAHSEAAWQTAGFDLLPDAQREQRAQLNRPANRVPAGLLHEPLALRAARSPDRDAVVDHRGSVSYARLQRDAVGVAALLRAQGVLPGALVAVALPKVSTAVSALFGVLTADAVYVPLDPEWPDDRIRYVLGDASAAAVLTDAEHRERLSALTDAPVLAVDDEGAHGPVPGTSSAASVPAATRSPHEAAYVIYTSGSTGRPKGAMLHHSGPLNTITEVNRRFGVTSEDVLFGISSLCFDLSVYDVFGALQAGAKLVLPEPGRADPSAWLQAAGHHGVTVWNSVPAIMQLLVEEAEATGARLPSLRTVLLSGDWIPVGLPDRIRTVAPNARVISLGGATEASIWSICHPVDTSDPDRVSIPYGKPLADQSWYVLDELGRDAPTWVTGHLYIGGAGVALGYLNDAEKTAAAFVTHPVTGERLYRTGDLGRYLPSGDIEFLGRADFQVKIQGFRVEPGEVEHALLQLPGIGQAAVVARRTESGNQLAAFVTPSEGEAAPEPDGVLAALGERLPTYMMPSHLVALKSMPLTANGKLDRQAMAALAPSALPGGGARTLPRTATETALVEIWQSVLATEPIGVDDDFFDLGGQSFTALRVIAQVSRRLGHRLPMGTLLERRTIAGLAASLDDRKDAWSPLVRLREGSGDATGTPWFLVHPAGGNVLCYRRLAELLDGTLYAVQAPGAATGHEPLQTMDEFVGLYVEELRKVRPHGPYRLGGWSSGAVIAAAMARRLEALGERVEHLVVIDAPAPLKPREVDEARVLTWFLEDLDLPAAPDTAAAESLREIAALPPDAREARLPEALRAAVGPDSGLDPADLADTLAVFRGVVRACNAHRAASLTADVTVVRARDGRVSEFEGHPHSDASDWGWSALTSGSAHAAAVPGTHHTLLTGPHVGAVRDAMTRCPGGTSADD